MPFRHRLQPLKHLILAAGCTLAALLCLAATASADLVDNAKQECVYTAHMISILDQFDSMIGENVNCVQVYIASPNWQGWVSPWFINYYDPNSDWSQWATTAGPTRQLIITQSLVPSQVPSQSNWLQLGAEGAYTSYDKQFAANLVAAGLGDSVIRLSPESNGTWNADSLGTTPAQWRLWDETWDLTVAAMRSVPGANFQFDFNIAALYRPLPLAQIYPGDAYVNFIGVDAYDSGNLGDTAAERWNTAYNGTDGIAAVAAFATVHNKPFSIPEWGIAPVSDGGFGDDPTFVNGIASVVENTDTAYQSYFYNYGNATQLEDGPLSLAAYIAAFGPNGTAVGEGGIVDSLAEAARARISAPVSARPAAKTHRHAGRSGRRRKAQRPQR